MRTVIITGASSGFGESCATLFAKKGWQLILIARRVDRLNSLIDTLGEKTPVHSLILDVRDRNKIEHVFETMPEKFQNVDVLINNAGLALGLESAQEAYLDNWDIMVDTNIKGLMYCTHNILPKMVSKNRGHIINIGSIAGDWVYPGANVYGATKAFVKQFSLNLRADLLGTRVRVTNIEPGLSETEFSITRFKGDIEKAADVYKGTKPLTGDDIAEIVYWVVSTPEHVNINRVEVMPTCQAWNPLAVVRENKDKE